MDDKANGLLRVSTGRRMGFSPILAATALVSLGLGAGAMYLMDVGQGRRRRAVMRDRVRGATESAVIGARRRLRDLGNRAKGLVGEYRLRLRSDDVPDRQLEERVRSKIGRVVANPSSVAIEAHDGRAIVSGLVLAGECAALLRAVARVPGVKSVENRLEVRAESGNVPGLQGARLH